MKSWTQGQRDLLITCDDDYDDNADAERYSFHSKINYDDDDDDEGEDGDDDDDDDLLLGLSFSGQLHRAHRLKDRIISKFNYLYSHHIYCNHSDVHLTPCHRYNYLGLPIT